MHIRQHAAVNLERGNKEVSPAVALPPPGSLQALVQIGDAVGTLRTLQVEKMGLGVQQGQYGQLSTYEKRRKYLKKNPISVPNKLLGC